MFVEKRMLSRSILALFVSGVCWWLSFDLGLHLWWPIWLAPVPILLVVPRLSGWGSFAVAFFAFLIGRCAWVSYLQSVLPVGPVVIFTMLPAILFGLTVLPARVFFRRKQPVVAAVSFAAMWTAVEFLISLLGRDGTIVSIAYTQGSFLPVIQVAALTGVAGISFVICFVPALAAGRKWDWVAAVLVVVLGFGWIRLQTGSYGAPVKVGMVVIPEAAYGRRVNEPGTKKEMELLGRYCSEIGKLGSQDMNIVLLPEKAIPVTDTTGKMVYDSLARMAARLRIDIVGGVTRISAGGMDNLAPVFSREGKMILNYDKVHLFEGEAIEGFRHGSEPGVFGAMGVAICKDLDFESYMRKYGQAGIGVLYAPAWDFVRDGWWHSRVAIVGAVANGYSLVRNAREGRLTISDDRGRVPFEVSSESQELTMLMGTMRPATGHTLYSRWGDWFGWLMVATAGLVLIYSIYLAARRSLTRV
jgi:apolipoprotein N-acyltransferase